MQTQVNLSSVEQHQVWLSHLAVLKKQAHLVNGTILDWQNKYHHQFSQQHD